MFIIQIFFKIQNLLLRLSAPKGYMRKILLPICRGEINTSLVVVTIVPLTARVRRLLYGHNAKKETREREGGDIYVYVCVLLFIQFLSFSPFSYFTKTK